MKVLKFHPTGSRYICMPPPTDTDEDWVILIDDGLDTVATVEKLEGIGFTSNPRRWYASNGEEKPFRSWRNGVLNWIVTNDPGFYERFCVATDIAKRLNLINKEDRLAVFQGVLYGERWPVKELEMPHE